MHRSEAVPLPLFVKPANLGSSVGISKVKNGAELEPRYRLAAEFDRKILVERGIAGREIRMLRAGQRAARRGDPLRNPAVARVLRLRRQVSAGHGQDVAAGAAHAGADRGDPAAGGRRLIRRSIAKAWRASISCWKRPPGSCISTRSIPSPASPPSACIRKCGSKPGCLSELLDRLIGLALDRAASAKASAIRDETSQPLRWPLLAGHPAPPEIERSSRNSSSVRDDRGECRRPDQFRAGHLRRCDSGMLRARPASTFSDPEQFDQLKQMDAPSAKVSAPWFPCCRAG